MYADALAPSLDTFESMLDFCFDLDVDLDLRLAPPETQTQLNLPPVTVKSANFTDDPELASTGVSVFLWWTKLQTKTTRPRLVNTKTLGTQETPGTSQTPGIRLILKSKSNRNLLVELLQVKHADCEPLEVFCSRLDALLAVPYDPAHFRTHRLQQLTNYYKCNNGLSDKMPLWSN